MTDHNTSGKGPVALHQEQFSQDGLFGRYLRGQIRVFWTRMAYYWTVSAVLVVLFSLQAGVLAFCLTSCGELIDTLMLRYARKKRGAGAGTAWLKLLTTLSSLAYGICIAAAAAVPFWVDHGAPVAHLHLDLLFTVGLLVGGAVNAGLVLPYHRWAVGARLLCYGVTPFYLIWSLQTGDQLAVDFRLQIAGLFGLYSALAWFMIFSQRSFARTQAMQMTQAMQQQELQSAYQQLLKQQTEAKKLALVARHANDGILMVDKLGKTSWVNDAFTRITGYEFKDIYGLDPGELLNHADTDPAAIRTINDSRKRGAPFRVEILNRRKDGQTIWVETNQVPIHGADGEVVAYVAIERDITEAKENARHLEKARAAAEEGARAKAEFLATMSHEIRTPMNGVIGMAQLLEETKLDQDQKLYTDTILSSARALLALINDILDLSKLDADRIKLSPVEFDLTRCFKDCLRPLRAQAEAKGLQLIFDQTGASGLVKGDDTRLRQILTNLVGNAIKFTEQGQVVVSLDCEETGDGQIEVRFSVTDTGIGIPRDMLEDIFERFTQADAAISRRFGGSGLGLSISRRLVSLMGGEITVRSQEDRGSCFSVSLILEATGGGTESPAPQSHRPSDLSSLAGLSILVAEDNRVNRLLVEKFLKQVPVTLHFAQNGAEAVDQARLLAPDIILMDISMPVLDGIEATRIIRASDLRQPVIIALTANAFDSDREACLAVGMEEFLTKPIHRDRLLAALLAFGKRLPAEAKRENLAPL